MNNYQGRLYCNGDDGHLRAYEATRIGDEEVEVYDQKGNAIELPDGSVLTVTVPKFEYGKNHGRPLAYEPSKNAYVFIKEEDTSHNDRFHQAHVQVAATSTAENSGEEHHVTPTEDDPHYSVSSPNLTKIKNDPDEDAPITASHTKAYTNE